MSKNKVAAKQTLGGYWFVIVKVGGDRLVLEDPKYHRPCFTDEARIYSRGTAALRAAHRIGKALNLPVEVE